MNNNFKTKPNSLFLFDSSSFSLVNNLSFFDSNPSIRIEKSMNIEAKPTITKIQASIKNLELLLRSLLLIIFLENLYSIKD